MQLETWALGVLVSSYCCSTYRVAGPFSSLGTFSSSSMGGPVFHPIDDCEHPLLYLPDTGIASPETGIFRVLSAKSCWCMQLLFQGVNHQLALMAWSFEKDHSWIFLLGLKDSNPEQMVWHVITNCDHEYWKKFCLVLFSDQFDTSMLSLISIFIVMQSKINTITEYRWTFVLSVGILLVTGSFYWVAHQAKGNLEEDKTWHTEAPQLWGITC